MHVIESRKVDQVEGLTSARGWSGHCIKQMDVRFMDKL